MTISDHFAFVYPLFGMPLDWLVSLLFAFILLLFVFSHFTSLWSLCLLGSCCLFWVILKAQTRLDPSCLNPSGPFSEPSIWITGTFSGVWLRLCMFDHNLSECLFYHLFVLIVSWRLFFLSFTDASTSALSSVFIFLDNGKYGSEPNCSQGRWDVAKWEEEQTRWTSKCSLLE